MEARTCPATSPAARPLRSATGIDRKTAERRAPFPAATASQAPVPGSFASARVVARDGAAYRVDNGLRVTAALSCLVKPEAGDLVQLFHADERCFITAILERQAPQADGAARSIELSVGGADTLLLTVPNLRCVASDSIALVAGKACEIASPAGRITLSARNLFTVAGDNLIQQARTSLTQAVNYSVKALELLHLKGRQQLISAETEVRLDGQYINMG